MIDQSNGLIYGEANETGDFVLVITASNESGADSIEFSDPSLVVLKGRQSILSGSNEDLLFYGDEPLDLNLSSLQGYPYHLKYWKVISPLI